MKPEHMIDAERLRIHGPILPMELNPKAGPSPDFPSKGRTRITVAALALCAAAVIHFLYRSF
ncbi:hypothetical protein [Novosphingobium sp. KN65.2]|uniref:hypothetical protein n=1 Tax=Novosphingobium sp. KN65.2 TaxID=1478134 RepID=UPI0005E56DC1|nr:hypothetical protein [Novosphingobium sp. KN65.2]CDO35028.1 hypothetical protein SPHV1_2180040 [Novosphingobium sp. KN65.2]